MPQEPLHIEILAPAGPGQLVLRLTGPLTISTLFDFQTTVRTSAAASLILDLTGVPYIDSAGIGALVGAYVTHNKDGKSLALVGVSDRIHAALGVTRVDSFFRFFPTLEDAQQAAR